MSRRSERLTPLPARTEDCFAQFDAVFNSLATELQWSDGTEEAIVPPAPGPADTIIPDEIAPTEIVPATTPIFALVPRAVETETALQRELDEIDALVSATELRPATDVDAPVDGGAADIETPGGSRSHLERFEEAFSLLDTQLARSDASRTAVAAKGDAVAAGPGSADQLPPVFEMDSSWFGEGAERFTATGPTGGSRPWDPAMAPPPVQQVRLAPSPSHLRNSRRPFTGAISRRPLPGGRSPLENVLALLDSLSGIHDRLARNTVLAPAAVEAGRDAIAEILADARQLCIDLDLQTAGVRADFARATLDSGRFDRLAGEIEELVRHIRHDLQSCSIWPIATSRVWALNLNFGSEVNAAFPSAQTDVAEGGICFGLARYTACVFHMVRAAERGLNALAVAADAEYTAPRQPQSWADLIAAIDARAAHIDTWPRGQAKTRAQEFFHAALDDAKALKESARKLTVRGTRAIDEQEALSVCNRTRDLLVRLSERISEAQHRTLGKRDFSEMGSLRP